MADRGILFSGSMVRALLSGTKTQTRRFVPKQPTQRPDGLWDHHDYEAGIVAANDAALAKWMVDFQRIERGDQLYVRETWRCNGWATDVATIMYRASEGDGYTAMTEQYPVDGKAPVRFTGTWRPGIHMPRWASRITLTVTDVRVERLQDISEADARSEGVRFEPSLPANVHRHYVAIGGGEVVSGWDARDCYGGLWEHINGAASWAKNPWVAAYTFTVSLGNIDYLHRQPRQYRRGCHGMTLSPELETLKQEALAVTCWSWADFKGWKLGPGTDKAGPCPSCGGKDRFAIHTAKNTFNCRRCDLRGGGVIDLVMQTEKVGFVAACELITGRTVADPVSAEEQARIAMAADQRERERAAEEDKRRLRAISEGLAIFNRSAEPAPIGAGGVADYLKLRGLPASIKFDKVGLREIAKLDYVVEIQDGDRKRWEVIHSGPAMIAAVVLPNNSFGAVHQTWLDVRQPKGKLVLRHPTRIDPKTAELELLDAKKVRGSMRGGAIRLYTPKTVHRIVMGEGIETTLTAMAHNFEPGTAYWAGINLGNMSGKAYRDIENKRHEDRPDMDDRNCFLPPDWCSELVYLSDETSTEIKITRGLQRAMALREEARLARPELPSLVCDVVPAAGGDQDLNELVRGSA